MTAVRGSIIVPTLVAGVLVVRAGRVWAIVTDGRATDRLSIVGALVVAGLLITLGRHASASASPFLRRLLDNPSVVRGGYAVLALGLVALLAPLLAPFDPTTSVPDIGRQSTPPSLRHPFGTDFAGRDLLSRLLYGARISLGISVVSVAISVVVGTFTGAMAVLHPRWDGALMRLVDTGLAFPRVFLLLTLFSLWANVGVGSLMIVLGATGWFGISRLVRSEALSIRDQPFMVATAAMGLGTWRRLWLHLLPNVTGPIIVSASLGTGNVILIESGLAYLGIGISEPTPSWGRMIYNGQEFLLTEPWLAVIPGLAIVATVLGFSLLGDGLQRTLNPRRG